MLVGKLINYLSHRGIRNNKNSGQTTETNNKSNALSALYSAAVLATPPDDDSGPLRWYGIPIYINTYILVHKCMYFFFGCRLRSHACMIDHDNIVDMQSPQQCYNSGCFHCPKDCHAIPSHSYKWTVLVPSWARKLPGLDTSEYMQHRQPCHKGLYMTA